MAGNALELQTLLPPPLREFASFILVSVYIPPQASVQEAKRMLANQTLSVEWTNPDSLVNDLSDFNNGNLNHELPKYRQLIKRPQRRIFWIIVTSQSTEPIMPSPKLHWDTLTTSWST